MTFDMIFIDAYNEKVTVYGDDNGEEFIEEVLEEYDDYEVEYKTQTNTFDTNLEA